MSVSPSSNSSRILSTPSASCFAPRPFGTSLASLYGLLTNPIGREVNIRGEGLRFFTRGAMLSRGFGYDPHYRCFRRTCERPGNRTRSDLCKPRGHKASGPRLLPDRRGTGFGRSLRRHRQRNGEGRNPEPPIAVDIAVMSELPQLRKIRRLPQVCRLVGGIRSVAAQCPVPVRVSSGHNAGSEVARWEGPLQNVIATRGQNGNLAHLLRGVLILVDQAGIVNGGGHYCERLQLERLLVEVANGF